MADTENRQLYDTKVIAQLFNVTVRRIQQLTQDGVLETVHVPGQRNKYDLIPTIQAYVKYLSDKAYGRESKLSETELREKKLQAETALKESQVELHQLKTAIASGKYISVEEVKLDYQRFFVTFKKFATGLPNRVIGLVGGYVDPVTARTLERDMTQEVNNLLRSFVVAAEPTTPQDGDEPDSRRTVYRFISTTHSKP